MIIKALCSFILTGCIITPGQIVPVPTGTKLIPSPTAIGTPALGVNVPDEVKVDTWHRIYAYTQEADDVWVFADNEYSLGAMQWDMKTHTKYMDINLNTSGKRELEFRVNGIFVYSKAVLVVQ